MLIGNPGDWIARFRSLDTRFLMRVMAVWPMCVARLSRESHEDSITTNLVEILSRDVEARRLFHYLDYQYEVIGFTDDGLAFSKGKIDMALLLDQEREKYLAYECKRLNTVRNGTTRSLATPYVKDGIRRFITEKYAADLPVGGMLGYVMNGDVITARSKVWAAIDSHQSDIGMVGQPWVGQAIGSIERFSSIHRRPPNQSSIEIRHALLPFPTS